MPLHILRIPVSTLDTTDKPPLTRESVIALARQATGGEPGEVRITVEADEAFEGLPIPLARVEVNSVPNGGWRLQYVSHPQQSNGLTSQIAPEASDLSDFVQLCKESAQLALPHAYCAQELEEEGLGPMDLLNLRLGNPAPAVPKWSDLEQLMKLLSFEDSPMHQSKSHPE